MFSPVAELRVYNLYRSHKSIGKNIIATNIITRDLLMYVAADLKLGYWV